MICSGGIVFEIWFQIIRKEKDFQYNKHNEKLNKNNDPQCFANGHISETFFVERYKLLKIGGKFHVLRLKVNQQLLQMQKYE